MKYAKLFLFIIAAMITVSAPAKGQDGPPPEDGPHEGRPDDRRPNLLAELGLSPEQVQQIRRMNQERRPAMMDAQRRLREANRDLDIAIYGEAVSEQEFQTRLKEFQSAQADIARLRFESELSVRKILTPEQLVRFRDLRRRFAEMRNNIQQRRERRHDGRGRRPMGDPPPNRPIN